MSMSASEIETMIKEAIPNATDSGKSLIFVILYF